MKKLLSILLIMTFMFCLTGCKGRDERVLDAIEELSDFWEDYYDEHDIKDAYLEIANTQIINIERNIRVDENHQERANRFEKIDYIVEFDLLSNAFDFDSENSSEYYSSYLTNNCVVVYKNGKSEVTNNLFNYYRASTYSTDFSGIIDSIENFHGEYDQIIELD